MPAQEYFSSDFDTARGKFLAACDTAGFPVTSFRHPGSASLVAKLGLPEALSGNLFVDVARAGSPDATRVLVLCPGDSESEGLFASAINVAWLASGAHRHLSKPMAVVMIHAITPDGVSWARIVAEASGEERKSKWSDAMLAAAEERFAAYAEAQGLDTSFAQTEQTEARRFRWPDDMLKSIATQFLGAATDVALLSLQLGLGAYGQAEIVPCHDAASDAGKRLADWYDGNDALVITEDSAPPGALMAGLMEELGDARVSSAVLECGVYSTQSVLASLGHRALGGRDTQGSAARIFCPQDEVWQSAVWQHSERATRPGSGRPSEAYAAVRRSTACAKLANVARVDR